MDEYLLYHMSNGMYMLQNAKEPRDFMSGWIDNFTEDLEREFGVLVNFEVDEAQPYISYFENANETIRIVNMF